MSRFSITLLHVLACLHHVLCLTRQCYDPPGTVANLDTPCTDDLDTFCCPSGWACLGNRVCEYTPWSNTAYDRPFFRASCTDPTWTSSACPLFCDSYPNATTGVNTTDTGGRYMQLCPLPQHNVWVCAATTNVTADEERCQTGANVTTLTGSLNPQTIIGGYALSWASLVPTTTTSTTSTNSISSSASPTSATTNSATSSSTPSPVPSGLSTGAKAGIGAGVPLGVLAAAVFAFLGWRRSKRKRAPIRPDDRESVSGADGWTKPELPGTSAPVKPTLHELPHYQLDRQQENRGQEITQLSDRDTIPSSGATDAATQNEVHELEGNLR